METKRPTPRDIDEYIAGFPDDVQETLQKIRLTIHEAAPDAQEVIGYQVPGFKFHGVLIYFAAYKKHIGLYPAPMGVEEFAADLAVYGDEKSTVRFPLGQPIPYELITRIVKFRMKENLAKPAAKKKTG